VNINLIGMRGVGKSNVARRLSVLSKRPVMSTDTLIEYEAGMTVAEFVAAHDGDWRAFRDAEYEVLGRLAKLDGLIVDCGGGVIVDLDEDNEECFSSRKVGLLRSAGPVVWLAGDIPRLAAKTAADPSRPSLHARLGAEQLMRRREPYYQRAADVTYHVERGERQQVAEAIAERFGLSLSSQSQPQADWQDLGPIG
jgi:shikimate kinase